MRNKVLVTGAAGFIGSHLTEYLLKAGSQVVILDNFDDLYDPLIKRNNIEEIHNTMKVNRISVENLEVIEADIRDFGRLDEIFCSKEVNVVVHLAAMAGVRPSIDNPLLYNDVNIKGTMNMLEMCKKYNIKYFVFASSSSVYGNNKKIPFSESDQVNNPISPYAATKKAGELLCYTYHYLYDIHIACLRFFTVYGPRQRPDLAIHKFTRMLFNNEEIPFYGDGTTERDYTFIDDIIDGIMKAINWVMEDENRYDIFNLGESNTINLKYMVEALERATSKRAHINRLPMQLGDVQRTYADISKAKEILGYSPSTEFEKGVEDFIDWYKKVNHII